MVNMAGGMDRVCVCPTTTKKIDVAQHGGRSPVNNKSWFTVYIFDIGHPYYGQLTNAKISYPLLYIMY